MTWIYAVPAWFFMSASVVGACALSCGLLALTRSHLTRNEQIAHNDVAGPVLTTIGTVLAVMMSFMVVGVWQQFDVAAQTAQREASALSDLYHLASAFPPAQQTRIQGDARRYIGIVLDFEWKMMARGGESRRADRLAYTLGQSVNTWKAKTPGELMLKSQAMNDTVRFWDARRDRILENRQGIPLVLWSAMLLTGALTVAFSFYFRVDRPRAQYLMVITMTAVIAIIFTVIAELDYPFRGDIAIRPDSLHHVIDQIRGTLATLR